MIPLLRSIGCRFSHAQARGSALLAFVVAIVAGEGCRRPPPPAPPPPPPPAAVELEAPPPVVLAPDEVSARLRPLFAALCEHAFVNTSLSSPVRATAMPGQPSALASPTGLTSLLDQECEAVGIDAAAVTKSIADIRRGLTSRQAHELVLAIYAAQAIHDADTGNLHRAHVLLTDTIAETIESDAADMATTLALIRQFFADVPTPDRLTALGDHLERYMLLRDEQLVLGGEHAAVLNAAGLAKPAASARDRLLTDTQLVTLPLVDLAIARADTYGWQPPAAVQEARSRLRQHVATLADSHSRSDAFFTDATFGDAEAERAAVAAAAKEWAALFKAGCPLAYDADEQRLKVMGVKGIASDERLAAASAWAAGGSADELAGDGAAHMLVALHWLAASRPDLARTALIAGAARLLHLVQTEGAADSDDTLAAAATLCRQLNAYRLLAAARLIPVDPLADAGGAASITPAELEIFLLAWRQAWLKAGLAKKPADAVIAEANRSIDRLAASRPAAATPPPDRYFFFDYRFLGDGVPEVMVTKAATEELVETAKQPELVASERFLEFLRGFQMPRDFSPGFATRWAKK